MSSSFAVFHHVIQLIISRHLYASITMWSARFTVFLCHFLTSLVLFKAPEWMKNFGHILPQAKV